jgi:hypothetical protein
MRSRISADAGSFTATVAESRVVPFEIGTWYLSQERALSKIQGMPKKGHLLLRIY